LDKVSKKENCVS